MSIYTEVADILSRLESKDYSPQQPHAFWNRNWLSDEDYLAMGGQAVKSTKWYNDGSYNVRRTEHPGSGWVEGRKKFKRMSPTQETRDKMSVANSGQIAYNKGVKGVSAETSLKMSESAKRCATSERMSEVSKGIKL